ncbi:MAG: FAD-dependent oxidoreductase [Thermodesulfobacteriota bacterium]
MKKGNIGRVVVAACSPELKGHVFEETMESAGLNRRLLSMANIREQCSWVHPGNVTQKAIQLIAMAVGRARLLQPAAEKSQQTRKDVLVIGGGFTGMKSAMQLSRLGLKTVLLERQPRLGGENQDWGASCGLDTIAMAKAIGKDRNIEVLTSSEVAGVKGRVGDFTVRIGNGGGEQLSRSFGGILVATGHQTRTVAPDNDPCVSLTTREGLFQMLQAPAVERTHRIVCFLTDANGESSRFSTLVTLNSALAVKRKWQSEVYVFCRNVKVDSEGVERLYRETREQGMLFLKFEGKPRIVAENGRVKVEAKDVLTGVDISVAPDLLVVEEMLISSPGTEHLSSLINIMTDSQGFFQKENVHLYPVASERKGIFFVGSCRGDLGLSRTMDDVSSAVAQLYDLLSPGKMAWELEVARVDPQKCRTCLTCIRVCSHSAIQLVQKDKEREVAEVSPLACEGCGICVAICPAKAIDYEGHSDPQILAQIEGIGAS